jgi:hypothetical protein
MMAWVMGLKERGFCIQLAALAMPWLVGALIILD